MNYTKNLQIKRAVVERINTLLEGTDYSSIFVGTYYSDNAKLPSISIGVSDTSLVDRSNGFIRYEPVNQITAYLSVRNIDLQISSFAELDEEAKDIVETIRNEIVNYGSFIVTVNDKKINFLTKTPEISEATREKTGQLEGYRCSMKFSGMLNEVILEGLKEQA